MRASGLASCLLALSTLACSRPPEPPPPAPAPPPPPTASLAPARIGPPPVTCKPLPPLPRKAPPPRPRDDDPRVKSACDSLARRRDDLGKKHRLRDPDMARRQQSVLDTLGRCSHSPRGAWALSLDKLDDGDGKDAIRPRSKGEDSYGMAITLVFVTHEGAVLKGPSLHARKHGSLSDDVTIDAVGDIDGDGLDEVLLSAMSSNTDEEHDDRTHVFTAQNGAIAPFAGADGLTVRKLQDHDGDGLADLVVHGPFGVEGPCGLNGQVFPGPDLLAHGVRGQKPSMTDAVARSFAREACSQNPDITLVARDDASNIDGEATVHHVACAVLWGRPADELTRRLAVEHGPPPADGAPSCVPLDLLTQVARTTPPFLLEGCAPGQHDPGARSGEEHALGGTMLEKTDIVVGSGAEATPGKQVSVHYTGTLTNGSKFDSSLDRGKPFSFRLGAGQVIQGWEQGVAGMKVGGKRKLVIPPELGYGARGFPPVIPANSTLVFEIELLGVS